MRLARALEDKKFDVRLSDKYVSDEKLSKKDLEAYRESLPDDAANATTTKEVEEKARANNS